MKRRLLFGGRPFKKNHIILNQNLTDPAEIISGDINSEAIRWIRSNSHRYLGKYIGDGAMAICQLDDTNSNYYADGAAADLTGLHGDVFMKLPRFYYHAEEIEPDIWDIGFSRIKDSDDWKEWDGNDLIGVYKAYYYNNEARLQSISRANPTVNVSQSDFKARAAATGTGYSLVKFKHHSILAFLFYAMYGNTNSQAICGVGTYIQGKTTGETDSLGMADTVSGGNGDSGSINFWGLENWWGDIYEFVDNVSVNNRVWTITEDDGSTRDVQAGDTNGWISKVNIGDNLDMVPIAVGASNSTGFCDNYYQNSKNDYILVRSSVGTYSDGGVAFAYANHDALDMFLNHGSRLAFRGQIVEMGSEEYLAYDDKLKSYSSTGDT